MLSEPYRGAAVVLLSRPDLALAFANAEAEVLLGQTRADLTGQPLERAIQLLHPETRQPLPLEVGALQPVMLLRPGRAEVGGLLTVETPTADLLALSLWEADVDADSQDANRQEQHWLTSLFERAPVAVALLTGVEHRFRFANALYRELFVHSRSYLGRSVAELLPEADVQGFVQLLDGVQREGRRFVGQEARFDTQGSDGSPVTLFLNFVYEPVYDAAGQVRGVLALIIDVSELVLARETQTELRLAAEQTARELENEQRKLESIFHQSPAMMALWAGHDLVFEKVNSGYQSMMGRELLGKRLVDAMPEMEGQPFIEMLRKVLYTGEPFVGVEFPAMVASGPGREPEQRFYDFSYLQITDAEGRPYAVYDHAIDVTDRVVNRRALEASRAELQRNQERLSRAVSVSKIGFFELDLQSGELNSSEQAQVDWGHDVHDFRAVLSRIVPAHRRDVRRSLQRAMEEQQPFQLQFRLNRPDGGAPWIELRGEFAFNAQGNIERCLGTSVDISDRQARTAELERARAQAERANETKTAFLANMSHEIRTPLGAILGFTELLRQGALEPEEQAEYLSVIARNGQALTHIIDDILDLAKVESGKLVIEILEFSLSTLMTEVLALFREKTRAKQLALSFESSGNHDFIASDPTRLRQILINIVGNAVKFTHQGGVYVEWHTAARSDGGIDCQVRVRDTGVGIPVEQRPHLFQAFVQADNTTTRKFGGTGLGLALSRRLAEAMGGSLVIEDQPASQVGTCFLITFVAAAAGRPAEPAVASAAALGLEGMHILVADDSHDNRVLIHKLLTGAGAQVDLTSNGSEAVERALQQPFDIVLMDLQMPVMDGYEAVRALRQAGQRVPVIALTAHAMAEERERTRRAGCNGHVTKPIQRDALFRAILELARP